MIDAAPWLLRIWATLAASLAAGRLGHALLFCGPPRLGKRQLAETLAQAVLCDSRAADGRACGRCRQCEAFARRYQMDPPETRPDGTPAHPFGHAGHPDARFVGFIANAKGDRMRSEIAVEQVRDLGAWFALTPRQAAAQVALIDPADALNGASANALLKTLEEPMPGRFLLLVSAEPARLPSTIRSRCQRVELRVPPTDEALAWLLAQGVGRAAAEAALRASDGHPGLALDDIAAGRDALRAEVLSDLAALVRAPARAAGIAARWAESEPVERLRIAAGWVRALGRSGPGGLPDPALAASGLTAPVDFSKLAEWFDEANRTRGLLDAPLRTDLLLTGLLLRWPSAWRQ